jgi:hypothetical protein
MGRMYLRYLRGAGLSIVMLQDGVGVGNIATEDVAGYVTPYLAEIEKACRLASQREHPIAFWLNVESIGADICRLQTQIALGKGHAAATVTFEFTKRMGKDPLYASYLRWIDGAICP